MLLALAGALALQTTLSGLSIGGGVVVDLVLVLVVYVALAYGAVAGLLTGTAAGLTQDALAGGVLGIGGFSKTLVGFFVGVLGAQVIVAQPLPRFVMFAAATLVHELCFQALSSLAESRSFRFEYAGVVTQAAVNAILGVVAFQAVEAGPGLLQRRRARSATLSRRRF